MSRGNRHPLSIFRFCLGLTQEGLASVCGASAALILRLENKTQDGSLNVARAMKKHYGFSLDDSDALLSGSITRERLNELIKVALEKNESASVGE